MSRKKRKFVSDEKFAEYKEMSQDQLVEALKIQHAYLEEHESKKKHSDLLKEFRSEINEYRKLWAEQNPEKVEEIESLKQQIKDIQDERDEKIITDLDEKKQLEGGFRDVINGAK